MTKFEGPIQFKGLPTVDADSGGYQVYLQRFTVTVAHGDLASAALKTLIPAINSTASWRVWDMSYSGDGTNFSGGGGDRLMAIADTADTPLVASTIPAASLQTLIGAKWGSAALPITDGPCPFIVTAGKALVAKYSGGAADYSAGSVVITVLAERIA